MTGQKVSANLRGGRWWKAATDQALVYEGTNQAAGKRSGDRHPPPTVAGAKHVAAPPGHRREEPRTEVARGIDRVARVEAERHSDQHHEQSDDNRTQPGTRHRVPRIDD